MYADKLEPDLCIHQLDWSSIVASFFNETFKGCIFAERVYIETSWLNFDGLNYESPWCKSNHLVYWFRFTDSHYYLWSIVWDTNKKNPHLSWLKTVSFLSPFFFFFFVFSTRVIKNASGPDIGRKVKVRKHANSVVFPARSKADRDSSPPYSASSTSTSSFHRSSTSNSNNVNHHNNVNSSSLNARTSSPSFNTFQGTSTIPTLMNSFSNWMINSSGINW